MTEDEVLALPVVLDLATANHALGLSRNTGYGMAKREEYPVEVLRHGKAYRVRRADLLIYLGIVTRSAV